MDVGSLAATLGAAAMAAFGAVWQTQRSTRATERAQQAKTEADRRMAEADSKKLELDKRDQELRGYTQLIDRQRGMLEQQTDLYDRTLREERDRHAELLSEEQRRTARILAEFDAHRRECTDEIGGLRERVEEAEARAGRAEDRAERAVRNAHELASLVSDEIARAAVLGDLDGPPPAP